MFDGCVWTLTQNDTHLSYVVQGPLVNSKNYDEILSRYFRLDVSLNNLYEKWAASDQYFKNVSSQINGVRILNQEAIENVFSFICSSNNNIQRFVKEYSLICILFKYMIFSGYQE